MQINERENQERTLSKFGIFMFMLEMRVCVRVNVCVFLCVRASEIGNEVEFLIPALC